MLRLRSGLATHGMGRSLLIGLVRATWFATLETRLKLVSRLGSAETCHYVSRQVIAVMRSRAFGDLPASALPMALWLLVTGDFLRPDDLGWEEWCQKVHAISVGGTHQTMLAPPTRDVIITELARLETALRAPRPIHEAVD
jgi:thioesterase domain-containing protein